MKFLTDKWYRGHWSLWLLSPLALLFGFISWFRRLLFSLNVKAQYRPEAKVIVVGNISVGGNGKTPIVLSVVDYFASRGYQVGVLSRGYGSKAPNYPHVVSSGDDPSVSGDEPLLLKRRLNVPVVIDPVRRRGARLLEGEFGCDLIVCDDGMQHYALARDVEIVVMDDRRWGNGYLLPMGPLREGKWRLNTVDAVLFNSERDTESVTQHNVTSPVFKMNLLPRHWVNVTSPDKTMDTQQLLTVTQPVSAIAGIGNPSRFFDQLKRDGITLASQTAFVDHHHYTPDDVPKGIVLMTEKDAVKIQKFAHENCWFLPVDAKVSDAFYALLENRINDKLIVK